MRRGAAASSRATTLTPPLAPTPAPAALAPASPASRPAPAAAAPTSAADIRAGGWGPNWFAAVMGTGIVAVAAAGLPVDVPGLRPAARLVWLLAAVLLVALCVASAKEWRRARAHVADPVMVQFYGAPPMALMTVGGGTLLLGSDWIPLPLAVAVDVVLWSVGTAMGLATAVLVPYLMITRHRLGPDAVFGGWLMPVVPPMVSAANGALLAPHVSFGSELLLVSYALFGASLLAAFLVVAHLWGRLLTRPPMPAGTTPTLWIVLGPLGQSITAAHLLAEAARDALPAAPVFALLFGVPVWGFAMFWLALAAALTLRALRQGMPFGLPWWSFTFPVGTLVTGTTGLATSTGSQLLVAAAIALFGLLTVLWLTVATRTLRSVLRLQHGHRDQPVAVDHLATERHQ
ncbi:TDT family transporter [Cryptosporangium minutisporangium]|uniref:TDT family transporter n=1 Tax=Cryptosporangium minutisporangium TaxID=113569 RepID=UPI00406BB280